VAVSARQRLVVLQYAFRLWTRNSPQVGNMTSAHFDWKLKLVLSALGLGLAAISIYLTYRFVGQFINIDAMPTKMRIAVWAVMAALLVGALAVVLWIAVMIMDTVALARAAKCLESGDLNGAWERFHLLAKTSVGTGDRTFQRSMDGLREVYSKTEQGTAPLEEITALHQRLRELDKAPALDEHAQPTKEDCIASDLMSQCRSAIDSLPRPTNDIGRGAKRG